jgi:hypothetical protein
MCDFSLQSVRSRPAKVGDKPGTRGFADVDDLGSAVCLMAGHRTRLRRRSCPLADGPTGLEDQDHQSSDGDLPSGQQREVGRTSVPKSRVTSYGIVQAVATDAETKPVAISSDPATSEIRLK